MPGRRTDGSAASPNTTTPYAMKNAAMRVLERERGARRLGQPTGQRDAGHAGETGDDGVGTHRQAQQPVAGTCAVNCDGGHGFPFLDG